MTRGMCTHFQAEDIWDCEDTEFMYLQCNAIGCFSLGGVGYLVSSKVIAQCDQEVVTIAVSDQCRGGVNLKVIQ